MKFSNLPKTPAIITQIPMSHFYINIYWITILRATLNSISFYPGFLHVSSFTESSTCNRPSLEISRKNTQNIAHPLEKLRSTLRRCDQSNDEDLLDLVARVLAHYQQYYEEKSRIANHDVSLVFSPPWFSPLERSFFWIAGFKPGLAFRIAASSINDMDTEQIGRMERLKAETKVEERELEGELARVQESVAAPPIVEVARRGDTLPVDGEYDEVESAMEVLKAEMKVVVANADMLRTRTTVRVVEVLSPLQNVRFLMAVAELQLKIRAWGS